MAKPRTIGAVLKALAFVLVLALLWHIFSRIGFANILEAMRGASRASVVGAAALYLLVFMLWSLRWQQLMRPQARKRLRSLFPITMAGIFGNTITPGARVGGEPVRAYYMSKAFGGQKSSYFGTVLANKLAYGAVFLGFLVASVVFVAVSVPLPLGYRAALGSIFVLVALAVISGFLLKERIVAGAGLLARLLPRVYNFPLLRFLRQRFPTYQQFELYCIARLENVWAPISRAAGSPRVILKVCSIGVLSWLVFCLAHYVLFRGLGADIGFGRVLVIVTVSTFFGDVSVSPGGAGFTEAVMLAMCAAFRVEHRVAAAAILVSRGLFYAYALGLGGLCLAGLSLVYGRRREDG